jgi:hypothetical protein
MVKNKQRAQAKSARAVKASGEDAGEGLIGGNRKPDMNTQDLNDLLRGKSASLADDSLVQSQVAYVPGQSKELLGSQVNQRMIGNSGQYIDNGFQATGSPIQNSGSMFRRTTNKQSFEVGSDKSSSLDIDDSNFLNNFIRRQILAGS